MAGLEVVVRRGFRDGLLVVVAGAGELVVALGEPDAASSDGSRPRSAGGAGAAHFDLQLQSPTPFVSGTRFDVVLSYGGTRTVEKAGYSGPVLVCNVRYVPIAGHRPARPATKFMTENRDISVWLAPVESQRVLVPVRISVRTMFGMGVAEASSWNVEGDAKIVPASARPVRARDAVNAGAAQ